MSVIMAKKKFGGSCSNCRNTIEPELFAKLENIPGQKDRLIFKYVCPKCKTTKYQIEFKDTTKDRVHTKVNSISEIEAMRYKSNPYVTKVETGSKQNLSWLYGNRGNIYNFNGKLIGKQNY